jgi:alpha-galactosidase
MTGYCGIMPLTNLANYQELEDPALRELDKRLCKVVFPSEEAIKKNNEIRAEIYKLLVETANANKQLAQVKKDKDEKAIVELSKRVKDMDDRYGQLKAKLQVSKAKRGYMAPDGRYGHKPGVLAFGYGRGKGYIGPEYGFGLALEQKLDAPILLIKVAQDGGSLAYEYRPPSSGTYQPTEAQKKQIEVLERKQAAGETVSIPDYSQAGKDWRRTVEFTREVLGNLKEYHPEYDPAVGYDLAGFVWFQGWSDNNPDHGSHYAENMTNLINDLRKALDAPNMLVVSGTPSYCRTKEEYEKHPVVRAQREVGQKPEFKGNVAIVETLPFYDHPIWPLYTVWRERLPEWTMVGSHVACHYLGSGRFFVRLGDALATSMVDLMQGSSAESVGKNGL